MPKTSQMLFAIINYLLTNRKHNIIIPSFPLPENINLQKKMPMPEPDSPDMDISHLTSYILYVAFIH